MGRGRRADDGSASPAPTDPLASGRSGSDDQHFFPMSPHEGGPLEDRSSPHRETPTSNSPPAGDVKRGGGGGGGVGGRGEGAGPPRPSESSAPSALATAPEPGVSWGSLPSRHSPARASDASIGQSLNAARSFRGSGISSVSGSAPGGLGLFAEFEFSEVDSECIQAVEFLAYGTWNHHPDTPPEVSTTDAAELRSVREYVG